jgi:hypothetical protein
VSARHLYLALTNPEEGREDDFNAWYDTYHVPEVVRHVPGFMSGRRFVLDPLQRSGTGVGEPAPWRYLAVYDVESDDLAETFAALSRHSEQVGFTGHDGALSPQHVAWLYSAAGPAVTGGSSLGDGEHLFLALTNPAEGRERDLNAWYDEHHLHEIVERMPGFVTGRRYEAHPERQRPGQSARWRYLALYDLRGDLAEIHRGDEAVRMSGTLTPSDGAFDPSFAVWVYTPIGSRVTAPTLHSSPA